MQRDCRLGNKCHCSLSVYYVRMDGACTCGPPSLNHWLTQSLIYYTQKLIYYTIKITFEESTVVGQQQTSEKYETSFGMHYRGHLLYSRPPVKIIYPTPIKKFLNTALFIQSNLNYIRWTTL